VSAVVVDWNIRRVLRGPEPPEVVRHLGKRLVCVVRQPHGEQSQPERQAGDELVAEEERLLLARGHQGNHDPVQVKRKLSTLQTGEAVKEPQIVESLLQEATHVTWRDGAAAAAGSVSRLRWRLGNMFGWFQDHDPNTSRKGTLSAVWRETERVRIELITIPPGGWRESGDRLRQIRFSIGELVGVCHTAGKMNKS
jgi:hypothetical protein